MHQCLGKTSPGSDKTLREVINEQRQDIWLARTIIKVKGRELAELSAKLSCLVNLYEDAWKIVDMNQRESDQHRVGNSGYVAGRGHIAEITKAALNLQQESEMKGRRDIFEVIGRHLDCAATEVRTNEAFLDEMKEDVNRAEEALKNLASSGYENSTSITLDAVATQQ